MEEVRVSDKVGCGRPGEGEKEKKQLKTTVISGTRTRKFVGKKDLAQRDKT